MKQVGWQRVEKDTPMKPFSLVKPFSGRSHHHTKRATNDDFSLHRLHHHHHHSHHNHRNHTTAAGIAALAAKCFRNLTLPANTAFVRRQRLRWAQPAPPSPSPPANPPTSGSTNPPPPPPPLPKSRLLRLIRRTLLSRRCRQSYSSWGSGSVREGGARRRYQRGRRQV